MKIRTHCRETANNDHPSAIQFSWRRSIGVFVCYALFLLPPAHSQNAKEIARMIDSVNELPVGLGVLPALNFPSDNLQNKPKADLGRRLFFDKILSADRSISCSSCHDPAKGFSDGLPRAIGFQGHALLRRTPSIWNAAYNSSQFGTAGPHRWKRRPPARCCRRQK